MTFRVRLWVCSSVAMLAIALGTTSVLASTPLPACGHANLNNPGNHYGLLKNGCLHQPPPPPRAPSPSPVPPPPPPPAAHPSPSASARPVSSGVGATATPGTRAMWGTSQATPVAPAPVALGPLDLSGQSHGVSAKPRLTTQEPNWWDAVGLPWWALLLLLLIALAATVALFARRRRQGAATSNP